jgi:hypothetical protein
MEDVSEAAGSGVTNRRSARGLAVGDFDNDGDVDIFINNMNEAPSLLENRLPSHHFLSVRLVGVKSNASAIGARVTLVAGGQRQVQEVRSGSTFMSHSDLRLHFGLGKADTVESIEIEWPYLKLRETVAGVKADQFITITEGRGITEAHE